MAERAFIVYYKVNTGGVVHETQVMVYAENHGEAMAKAMDQINTNGDSYKFVGITRIV